MKWQQIPVKVSKLWLIVHSVNCGKNCYLPSSDDRFVLAMAAEQYDDFEFSQCSDLEKSATLSKAIEHLRVVTVERSYYRSITEDCRRSIRLHFSEGGKFQPPPLSSMIPANSKDKKVHYSFDYVQMVSQ